MFFFIFYQRISTLRGTLGTGTRNCVDTQVGTITGHDGEGRGLGRGRAVVVAGSGARGGGSAGGSLGAVIRACPRQTPLGLLCFTRRLTTGSIVGPASKS